MRSKKDVGDITSTSVNLSTLLNFNNFGVCDDHVQPGRANNTGAQIDENLQMSNCGTANGHWPSTKLHINTQEGQNNGNIEHNESPGMKSDGQNNSKKQSNNNDARMKNIDRETDKSIEELFEKEQNVHTAERIESQRVENQSDTMEVQKDMPNMKDAFREVNYNNIAMKEVRTNPNKGSDAEHEVPHNMRNNTNISEQIFCHRKINSEEIRSDINNVPNAGADEVHDNRKSPINITGIYNIVHQHRCSLCPLFTVNYVTVRGRLCISVLYYTDLASKSTAELFAKKLYGNLIKCKV